MQTPHQQQILARSGDKVCSRMEHYELDYDIQEVHLSQDFMYKITTVANEALPLELLLDLETRRYAS